MRTLTSRRRGTNSRRSWQALVLVALVAVFALAGCGANGASGPLLAASVNGQGIALDDYQQLLNYSIKASAGSASLAWQTPTGRQNMAQTQTTVLNFLINLELARQQANACGVKVTQKDIEAQQKQLQSTINSVLKDPSDPNWAAFHALATLPRALALFSEQQAYQAALIKVLKVPTAHVRYIVVANKSGAQNLVKQLDNGADFSKLSQQAGTTNAADAGVQYVGQFLPELDSVVLANVTPSASGCFNNRLPKAPAKYRIFQIPAGDGQFGGQYAVVETTAVATAPLAALNDAQTEGNVFSAWIATLVRSHAKIEKYPLPATSEQATAASQQ